MIDIHSKHRQETIARTSEVIYPPIALRGLEAWAKSGDQRDTGPRSNDARAVKRGTLRGIRRSHVDRIHTVLAIDTDPGIALANDVRAVVVVREVNGDFGVERAFEARRVRNRPKAR